MLQQGRVAACRSDEACAVAVEHPVVPQQRVALFNVRNDSSVDQPHIQQLLHDSVKNEGRAGRVSSQG
eukprot:COSAG06_NODE_2605_length_6590_cov_2.260360_2_plen_68_part_00